MSDILQKIVSNKKAELNRAMAHRPLHTLKSLCDEQSKPTKDFYLALASTAPSPAIIAECKRKSPSKGILCDDYQPDDIAQIYEQNGAAAISVLTDEVYFGGNLDHLNSVASQVSIPVIRKDFIIEEYQVYEARAAGASSFLLLASLMDAPMLQYLCEVGRDLGMEPLVEVHTAEELATALRTDARIIGINARNLKDMTVSTTNSLALIDTLDADTRSSRLFVLESGVQHVEQICAGLQQGFRAFLIGEALMTAENPGETLTRFREARA